MAQRPSAAITRSARGAGILLLTGDEVAVAQGEGFEAACGDEVGLGQFAGFFLDPEGLDAVTDEAVGEILFAVGKAGPGAALHEQVTVGEAGLQQDAGAVADDGEEFARLPNPGDVGVQRGVVDHGDHGRLAACEEDGVIGGGIHLGDGSGALEKGGVGGAELEAEREDVMGGIARGILRVGEAVGDEVAALRADDIDAVACLGEGPVGVGEFGPPEADRPAGDGRGGGVGGDHQDAARAVGIEGGGHGRSFQRGEG